MVGKVIFTEKWKHLASKQPHEWMVSTTTATTTNNAACIVSSDTVWLPITQAKDIVPNFTMQHFLAYFIERKVKENESNKDYKNVSSKAFGLFRHGHIQQIEVACEDDKVYFKVVQPSKNQHFFMFFYKKLSISPKLTHGDNCIFAVFDLIFYYCCCELANDAPRWATKQEQS